MHYILYVCTKIIQELFCFKYFKNWMISCFQLKPCVKCFSNLFKKVFKLKKLIVEPKTVQPVELNEEPIDCQLNRSRSGSTPSSTCQGLGRPPPAQPVEGAKNFLSSRTIVQPVKVKPQSIEVRSRSGRGLMVTCQALNDNSQSTGRPLTRPVKPPTASLTFFFYKNALIFIV